MTTAAQWIRNELAANVAEGIGKWGVTRSESLGKSVYEYADEKSTIRLFERGLTYIEGETSLNCEYRDVDEVRLLKLADLVKVSRNPNAPIRTVLVVRGNPTTLTMPLKVFSPIGPALRRIVEEGLD